MTGTQQNKKKQSQHSYEVQHANERGVFAVRRLVANESYDKLHEVTGSIQQELKNVGRTFEAETIGITVIGFSRFCYRHMDVGPITADITENVPSSKFPIVAQLGRLGIYGPRARTKLAIDLQSDELINEERAYSEEYAKLDFPLNSRWPYVPHCSVALVFFDHVEDFSDDRTLNRLNRLAGLGKMIEQTIVLDPISCHGS
jgi:hypothetical protein